VRILCLCSIGPPPTGQANVSNEVIRYLRAKGDRVFVIDKKVLAFGWRKSGHYARSLLQIFGRLLFGQRPQLAYLACSRSPEGFLRDALFISLCRLRGVPVINHVHGADLPALLQRRWVGPVARHLLNAASCNVMLSYALAAEAERAGIRNGVVVRNFAPPDYFEIERSPRPNGAPLRILFLSNVMQAKGVFDLIEACRMLRRNEEAFELNIVGHVLEGTQALQQQTRHALGQLLREHRFVRWSGPLVGEKKRQAYAEADVFCLPSHAEAAPMSLLEAMATGIACVVTDVGGVPERVAAGESALVVPPHQPATLAEKLRELADCPELRRRLGERAREHARKHFALERFHRELGHAVATALGPSTG